MSPTTPERLATLEAQNKHQSEKLEEFRVETREDIASVRLELATANLRIGEIKEILTRADGGWRALLGGWRTLVAIGGVIGGLAAGVHWLWVWLSPLLNVLPR